MDPHTLPGRSRRDSRRASRRLERVADPLDPRLTCRKIMHHEHVEPDGKPGKVRALLQQLLRGARDAPLLAPVDARGGGAEGGVRAGAHLGDHEHAALASDEVELAQAAAVVALEDLAAVRAQKFRRQILGALAALLSRREQTGPPGACASVRLGAHGEASGSARNSPSRSCAQLSSRRMRRSGSKLNRPVRPAMLTSPRVLRSASASR